MKGTMDSTAAPTEVADMEFTITCPIDGPVTVSLEDIDTVVLREAEHADITFVCPQCGSEITVSAVVPSFLMAAIEALAEEGDTTGGPFAGLVSGTAAKVDTSPYTDFVTTEDPVTEAYCEYFRRQLTHIDSVDDVLAEIDSNK
jgi:hypothetical protein